MRILWQLELFVLNSMHEMQFSKKIFGDSDKKAYFCSNKSHHASQRCVPRWDFAFYKGYMNYDKQPINVEEQVANNVLDYRCKGTTFFLHHQKSPCRVMWNSINISRFWRKYLEKSNKNSIFAALESATLPIEQRTRAELFVYMRMEYINAKKITRSKLDFDWKSRSWAFAYII